MSELFIKIHLIYDEKNIDSINEVVETLESIEYSFLQSETKVLKEVSFYAG